MKSPFQRSDRLISSMHERVQEIIEAGALGDYGFRSRLQSFAIELRLAMSRRIEREELNSRDLDTKRTLGYFIQCMEEIDEKVRRFERSTKTTKPPV